MGEKTKILWCDSTWSPWIGCHKVSPACDHCYAYRWAGRTGRDFRIVEQAKSTFDAPLRWKEPRRIFVCQLSDFFIPDVPLGLRTAAIRIMTHAPQHTYMLLTKRPQLIRMALIGTPWENGLPENIWLGVTVENQETADRRIPFLLKESAAVKFISVEPMLSNINIVRYISPRKIGVDFATRSAKYEHPINWVICGGESGPGARPLNPHWARSLRDQCVLSDVPFMFKQWGEWTPDRVPDYDDYEKVMMDGKYPGETEVMARVGIVRAGRTLDGIDWNERPGATCQAK